MKADYILILGGPLNGEAPSPLLMERVKKGAALAQAYPHTTIVVSGGIKGDTQPLSEAEVMRRALLSLGIEDSRILLEDRAKTTLQNFQFTKALLGDDAAVAFVTNRFHVWRSKKIMQKAGVHYEAVAAPNGEGSLGFRIREAFLRPLSLFGIIW